MKKQDLLAVFAIGIPASVTNLMQSLGMALMNRYLVPVSYTHLVQICRGNHQPLQKGAAYYYMGFME